ncbi:MAG: dethiobiotin synthase [Steroidobacteraceae bacterium]|nr:dethiobiotin synthase [Steroidobacteraceae bacterium]MDW8260831.1 dethiobiotin synthase [Gammaproteobacteria bacterium]
MTALHLFVTGTDMGVGKTYWSVALLRAATARGLTAAGFKPVAAGAAKTADGWRNDDALALQRASLPPRAYAEINPICLPLAASPHLAARAAGITVQAQALANAMRAAVTQTDVALVEGAGGWLAPLSDSETVADLARAFGLPVLLVVGIRLGCLNHAQLTMRAILNCDLPVAGWIANEIADDHQDLRAQVDYLSARFDQPPLAVCRRGVDRIALDQLSSAALERLLHRCASG